MSTQDLKLFDLLDGLEMTKSQYEWLARRFENMTAKEALLFRGAMQIEQPQATCDVMQIANQLEHYELLYGAGNDFALGNFVMEHIFYPSSQTREFLDPAKVGAAYRQKDGNTFCDGNFIRLSSPLDLSQNSDPAMLPDRGDYGVSVCVAGATGSGKTTVAGWLLTTIPDNKRVFTIENGSRELDLVREKDGKVCNSVIHTITRESENAKQNIDQDMLLDMALRYHPDIICVGEMRSAEAYAAQEAARTGHGVLTTIHSNSSQATWRRMVTLCKRKHEMSDDTLMDLVTEAFPVVAFAKQLEDKSRKIMEIMECVIQPDGSRQYNTLYHFAIEDNRLEDGKYYIDGHHEPVHPISANLQKHFIDNGMPQQELDRLLAGFHQK